MFKRKILLYLNHWKAKKNRKPLIIRGARQVGKTTAIEMFSKNFDQYIHLDLEKPEDKELFEKKYNVDDLTTAIYLQKGKKKIDGKTLIFIDEIQNSSEAVRMLRYFYEEKPELYVIAAGSLLESLIDIQTSFPVGRVEYAYMYPVTFFEFLEALGEKELLKQASNIPLKEVAHRKLLELFHKYTLIGGMPEIVENYVENREITSLNSIYESLQTSYLDDVEKYATNRTQRETIRHAISSAPYEVGKRIKFQGFGNSNYRSREMSEALRLLEKSLLIEISYPTTSTNLPVSINKKKSPKLHFLDVGLINYFANLQSDLIKIEDLNSIFKGVITENVVAQELKAIKDFSNARTVFWVRESKQSNSEVDFVLSFKNLLVPVEVKSGSSGSLRSLHHFMDLAPHEFAIKLSPFGLSIEKTKTINGKVFKLLNLPYYLSPQIYEYMKRFVDESK